MKKRLVLAYTLFLSLFLSFSTPLVDWLFASFCYHFISLSIFFTSLFASPCLCLYCLPSLRLFSPAAFFCVCFLKVMAYLLRLGCGILLLPVDVLDERFWKHHGQDEICIILFMHADALQNQSIANQWPLSMQCLMRWDKCYSVCGIIKDTSWFQRQTCWRRWRLRRAWPRRYVWNLNE